MTGSSLDLVGPVPTVGFESMTMSSPVRLHVSIEIINLVNRACALSMFYYDYKSLYDVDLF